MAKHLAAHPEGVMPDMSSSINRETPYEKFSSAFYSEVVAPIAKDRFRTAIGKPGDIYLLHPLMVHSAQPNYLRGKLMRICHKASLFIQSGTQSLSKPFNVQSCYTITHSPKPMTNPLIRTTHHNESARRTTATNGF